MGAIANAFMGHSDEELKALARIIEREDLVLRVQPGELEFPSEHVRADLPRFQLLNDRIKLQDAIFNRKSDRNFYTLLIFGAVLFVKTGMSWAELIHFFAAL